MSPSAGKNLADLLSSSQSGQAPSFVCRKLALSDLSIEVEGVGVLRFPVTATQPATPPQHSHPSPGTGPDGCLPANRRRR